MKDILFITHFTKAPNEKGNGRFHYMAEKINKEEAEVEVVTSSYAHKGKAQRTLNEKDYKSISYKFTMLHEPGYDKNLSIKRLYSHWIFGNSLKRYLLKRKKPDVIYCSIPSVSAAYIAAKYAKKNNIPFVIDVQDLWPEAFKMVFNIPIISDIIFRPMSKRANYAYSVADEIVGVSESYAKRPLENNSKINSVYPIPLGTDLEYFDRISMENKHIRTTEDDVWLTYIGTLGHAYDIKCVIDALSILKNKGIDNIKFKVMGDGPLKTEFENHAIQNNVDVDFMGRLEYQEMAGVLVSSDIAVNPISKGAVASIINKHGDYAAAGLPVLNTQESIEYKKLVEEYNCGLNSNNNDARDLAEKLEYLYHNKEVRMDMGRNSRKLAEEFFDRAKTYEPVFDMLLNKL